MKDIGLNFWHMSNYLHIVMYTFHFAICWYFSIKFCKDVSMISVYNILKSLILTLYIECIKIMCCAPNAYKLYLATLQVVLLPQLKQKRGIKADEQIIKIYTMDRNYIFSIKCLQIVPGYVVSCVAAIIKTRYKHHQLVV